jgi:hypothetical protein
LETEVNLTVNPVEPDDLVQISLVVPARLAPSVEQTILRLLTSESERESSPWAPAPEMYSDIENAWDMDEWSDTPEDRQRMAWLVADLDPKHIDILSRIHNEPNTPTSELLSSAGYPDGAKASGVFRAITSRFRKVNRKPLWEGGEQTPDGQALKSPGPSGAIGIRLFAEAVANLDKLYGTGAATDEFASDFVDWDAVVADAQFTEANVALLEAFRSFPMNRAHAGMLAEQLGFKDYRATNLAIGALGKRLAESRSIVDPSYELPKPRGEGSPGWWHVVAEGEVHDDDGLFWWTLRPNLDAALLRAGI